MEREAASAGDVVDKVARSDGVVIEELAQEHRPSAAAAAAGGGNERSAGGAAAAEPIALPPNRPGRIPGPEDLKQQELLVQKGTPVKDIPVLRRIAIEEADRTLPNEIAMMLHGGAYAETAEMCGLAGDAASEELGRALAERVVDVIWAPLAGCTSRVLGMGEKELRPKVQLFWRCAVALCAMPLRQLANLSVRKRPFLKNLDACLPLEDASPAESRLAHLRLNLPVFAMTAQMPSEREREREKEKEREDLEREKQAKAAATSASSLPSAIKQPQTLAPVEETTEAPTLSAAKHTYDHGYKQWEKFDVEAELRELDRKAPKKQAVRFTEETLKMTERPEDPLKALDEAIANLTDSKATEGEDTAAAAGGSATAAAAAAAKPAAAVSGDDNGAVVPGAAAAGKACGDTSAERAGEAAVPAAASPPSPGTAGEASQGSRQSRSEQGGAVKQGFLNRPQKTASLPPNAAAASSSAATATAASADAGAEAPPRAEAEAVPRADADLPRPVAVPPINVGQPQASAAAKPIDYRKWNDFDVDAALRDVDEEKQPANKEAGPNAMEAKKPAGSKESEEAEAPKKPAVKRGFLNAAPPKGKKKIEDKRPAPKAAAAVVREDAAPASDEPTDASVAEGSGDGSTAASLTKDYQKWDDFDDEVSDEDDGLFGNTGGMDLDALTGPKEEVERIRTHWKRTNRAQKRAAGAGGGSGALAGGVAVRDDSQRRPAPPSLPEGPVTQRPCIYRPPSHPEAVPAQAINRDYDKWKKIDTDAIELGMDNEGKTEEGNAMRVEARPGSAMLQCENYTKDREEYDLDKDISTHVGSLKKMMGQRLKDGVSHKNEGNSLLRSGSAEAACQAYRRGLQTMELCDQAMVLMSDGMEDKTKRLIADLHRNLAAAQLEMGDNEGARASCDAALSKVSAGGDDDKARFRRALALLRLGREDAAGKDIAHLAKACGEDDAGVKRLRAEREALRRKAEEATAAATSSTAGVLESGMD